MNRTVQLKFLVQLFFLLPLVWSCEGELNGDRIPLTTDEVIGEVDATEESEVSQPKAGATQKTQIGTNEYLSEYSESSKSPNGFYSQSVSEKKSGSADIDSDLNSEDNDTGSVFVDSSESQIKIVIEGSDIKIAFPLDRSGEIPDRSDIEIALKSGEVPPSDCKMALDEESILVSPEAIATLELEPNSLYSYSICVPTTDGSERLYEISSIDSFYTPTKVPVYQTLEVEDGQAIISIDPNQNPEDTIYFLTDDPSAPESSKKIELNPLSNSNSTSEILFFSVSIASLKRRNPTAFGIVAMNHDGIFGEFVPKQSLQKNPKDQVKNEASFDEIHETDFEADFEDELTGDLEELEAALQRNAESDEELRELLESIDEKIEALIDGYQKVEKGFFEDRTTFTELIEDADDYRTKIQIAKKTLAAALKVLKPHQEKLVKLRKSIRSLKRGKKKTKHRKKVERYSKKIKSIRELVATEIDTAKEPVEKVKLARKNLKVLKVEIEKIYRLVRSAKSNLVSSKKSRKTLRKFTNEAKKEKRALVKELTSINPA